ncbi:hypothetical protein Pmani_013233 [Petrolisthes manimaculis]|uniref:C-type lectin domain-containing protein n=1 Tax=Petrolisthes manimaculis TaxID=1843537 RepID=A0AAE1U9T1_9EUCA|nr:hypothetical protein Pmani_013233 [Petrolisthes manimaculis]
MADLQLYDREMTEQDMESYMNCSKLSYHPLLTMENELLQVEGSARLINISAEEVCEQPTSMVVMHQNKLKFKDAEMWCSKFGGSLVLPENNVTDTALFLDFLPSVQSCVQSSGHFYWLGAVGNLTTGKWQNYVDGEPLIWDNFYLPMKNVTERSKCLSVYKYFDYPIWVSTSCDMEMCVGCSFDNNPKLALRGLCPGSLFDKSYFIIGYSNGSIEYRGMSHTYLKMSCGTWVIKSRIFINLLAKMVMRTEQDIPLGRHLWTLQGDTCEQKEVSL